MASGDRIRCWRRQGCLALTAGLLVGFALSGAPRAQQPTQPAHAAISFQSIATAQRSLTIDADQVRHVFDGGSQGSAGRWVAMEERLRVKETSGVTRFRLDFEGIAGVTLTDEEKAERSDVYWSFAGYLFEHGGFRVNDPVAATQNYLLFYLDSGSMLGRSTHRFAVLPFVFGRNAWLVNIDAATSYPLYSAEFNAAGQLVSALEVTRFDPSAVIDDDSVEWWEPLKLVQSFPSVAAALAAVPPVPVPIPTAEELPYGYSLQDQRVVQSDVNTRQSLVLTYGDGIDEFFIVHTFEAPRPALPAVPSGETDTPYAIIYYQDLSVAQLLFYVREVETMVIGRAGQYHLPVLARDLLRHAVLQDY